MNNDHPEVDRIAESIMHNDVLANCSQLVDELRNTPDALSSEDYDELLSVSIKDTERYCEDQYRYIVDLDERGEYRATIWYIDEEDGEESEFWTVRGEMFAESGELEGLDKDNLDEIVEHFTELAGRHDPFLVLDAGEDPETEEGDPEEALEHWIVSDWLARHLEEHGEMVAHDFMGLTIWGRTCSGQAIEADGVIREIARKLDSMTPAHVVSERWPKSEEDCEVAANREKV